MKATLTIISSAPYRGSRTVEKLEAAMVCAAFDLPSRLLFRGAGLHNLNKRQDTTQLSVRNVAKIISALPTYEIDEIYVCAMTLDDSPYTLEDLVLPVTPLSLDAQSQLIAKHEIVFGD